MDDKGMKRPLWQPQDPDTANATGFMSFVNHRHHLHLKSYEDLYQWSIGPSSEEFWRAAYDWLELAPPGTAKAHHTLQPQTQKRSTPDLFPPPNFFPDQRLNIAEHLLRKGKPNDVAIYFAREGVPGVEEVTWERVRRETRNVRDAMISTGVNSGDTVAAVVSNSVYSVVLALACLSIGAVWSSASPDLGANAILDRFSQVNPKIIFTDDGYVYAGKTVDIQLKTVEWARELGKKAPAMMNVVVLPYLSTNPDLSVIYQGIHYDTFLQRGIGRKLEFEMFPFSHPAFILYSSGTTGPPKCIVHSAGGVLLKVKTDTIIQHDARDSDIMFQFTTTSWVMWVLNFVNISAARSILLYDGSPFHPKPTILLELAEQVGVSIFGTSPRYLSEIRARGIHPRRQLNLSKLRVVTSTGAVLPPELYNWFYKVAFPERVHLISMSGGTDIAGSFVGGTPLLPVYCGEMQVKALGMAVNIFDSERSERVSIEGQERPGELVCTKPFPSQPLRFVGRDGSRKYHDAYFGRYGVGVWCQGDYVQRFSDTGGFVFLGRSDGVLNPSGVRFGSSEIYAVVESISEIVDSICVGQRRSIDSDERVLLFVKLKAGLELTEDLVTDIKIRIKDKYSARHVPKYIFQVADIPYTLTGKKCEINVKNIVCGRRISVGGTVANPESLKLYENYRDLPTDDLKAARTTTKL